MTGRRPMCAWGGGDLPGPYAEGDVIDVPEGTEALASLDGASPGRYKIVDSASIDEGDGWYYRIGKYLTKGPRSYRLHVVFMDRVENRNHYGNPSEDLNRLAGCTLIRTVDPDGLALRERMLADGWQPHRDTLCPTCGHPIRGQS